MAGNFQTSSKEQNIPHFFILILLCQFWVNDALTAGTVEDF
jgi:hypothetical protein